LEEQGKLSVNDPLTKFFPMVSADKKNVTLHQLMTHSAGFPHSVGFIYDKLSKEKFLDEAFKVKLVNTPGTKYHYSNIGYGLLGVIIEEVTKSGHEEFIRKAILKPANLNETGYRLVERDEKLLAVGYGRDANWYEDLLSLKPKSRSIGHSLQHKFDDPAERWNLEGSGGFLSNLDDMHNWYLVIRSGGILNANSWGKMLTPYIAESAKETSYYGYGWVIDKSVLGHKRIWHDGSNGYTFANFQYYPELDLLIFYATNNNDDNPNELFIELERLVVSEL